MATLLRTPTEFFVPPGERAFDLVEWELRDASIAAVRGAAIPAGGEIEVPATWSPLASAIAASRYLQPAGETSVRQMVDRVAGHVLKAALAGGYFSTPAEAQHWAEELRYLVVTQRASFNSPVWFNVGVHGRPPQAAACFINHVEDSMEAILELARVQAMLFKFGSGSGTNLSVLRSSQERLDSGGLSSGPVPFMKALDALAGAVRAGSVRRAASMVALDATHPDVLEFVRCKAREERKAEVLVAGGFSAREAYATVAFQNANHSLRVGDRFLRAVVTGREWQTLAVTDGRPLERLPARDLWREIAEAAWSCGDPGLQFDDTIQVWNPVPNTGRINSANPCSEFTFLDDTACNLVSLNLLAFAGPDGFDVDGFRAAVRVCATAQDVLVSASSYPTPAIAENSHRLRPLGLGFTNLGALLIALGIPYDSDAGRAVAGSIAALMTGEGYAHSARLAERLGAFAEFERNRTPMLGVLCRHAEAAAQLPADGPAAPIGRAARESWREALDEGARHGFRNAQMTAIAPTGTISLLLDCDTTGIEPLVALVRERRLVEGAVIAAPSTALPLGLRRLGYTGGEIAGIMDHVDAVHRLAGAPRLLPEDAAVLATALGAPEERVEPLAQVQMVAAVQPFISGSVAKTVLLPESADVDDVADVLLEAWRLGLKSVAVYRDHSKLLQPIDAAG